MNGSQTCSVSAWFRLRLLLVASAAGLGVCIPTGIADAGHGRGGGGGGGGGHEGYQDSQSSSQFSSTPRGDRSGGSYWERSRSNYEPSHQSYTRSAPSSQPRVSASQPAPRSVSNASPPLMNRMSGNASLNWQPRESGRYVASADRQDRSFEGGRSDASSRSIQRTTHESSRSESSNTSRGFNSSSSTQRSWSTDTPGKAPAWLNNAIKPVGGETRAAAGAKSTTGTSKVRTLDRGNTVSKLGPPPGAAFSKDRGSVKDLRGAILEGNQYGKAGQSTTSRNVQTSTGAKSGSDAKSSADKSAEGSQKVFHGTQSKDLKGATVREFKGGTSKGFQSGTTKDLKGGSTYELKGGTSKDFQGGTTKDLKGGGVHDFKGDATKDFKGGTIHDFKGGTTKGPSMKVRDFGKHGSTIVPGPRNGKGAGGPDKGMHVSHESYKDFSQRVHSGQLDYLNKGPVAKELKLGDQYRMHKDGDVARRMGLYKYSNHHYEIVHPMYFRGHVHPAYPKSCFRFHYWGPSFFISYCWYPNWVPWVGWSWYYSCDPFWDPRPLWCRPIIYRPCVRWVYWPVPVWVDLPVEPSGTWVDVAPVAIEVAKNDLQLLAVRFVDPGHPEEKLGPRYRVWFRNNSAQAIQQPFDVMLFASNDGKLAADLPQAGVRVPSIAAGAIQSVDIRLPIEVYQMGRDAKGQPAPFAMLHALVDANREVVETTKANNGATVARGEVLPVDPAAFEVKPAEAAAGAEVVLAGEGFGPEPGKVLVHLGGIEMEAEILGWYDLGVRLSLPKLPLAGATEAELVVVRADGAAANPLSVKITPQEAAEPVLAPPVVEKAVEKNIPAPPAPGVTP